MYFGTQILTLFLLSSCMTQDLPREQHQLLEPWMGEGTDFEKVFETDPFLTQRHAEVSAHSEPKVLYHFWASWCPACRKEFPSLVRFSLSHPDVKVIAISVDDESTLESAVEFFQLFEPEFPLYFDHQQNFYHSLKLRPLPLTLIFDRGRLAKVWGTPIDFDKVE